MTVQYTQFEGTEWAMDVYEGRRTALFLPYGYKPTPSAIPAFLASADFAFDVCADLSGAWPQKSSRIYNNKTIIAVVARTCGPGCGVMGSAGIQIEQNHFHNGIVQPLDAGLGADQVIYYEMGRNFWHWNGHGQLAAFEDGKGHFVITGYAVLVRAIAMRNHGVPLAPFKQVTPKQVTVTIPWIDWYANLEALYPRYVAAGTPWMDAFFDDKVISAPASPTEVIKAGSTDLFASFMLTLERECSPGFIGRFWRILTLQGGAFSINSAADQVLVVASAAAGKSLTGFFKDGRWPITPLGEHRVAQMFSGNLSPGGPFVARADSGPEDPVLDWGEAIDEDAPLVAGTPFREDSAD